MISDRIISLLVIEDEEYDVQRIRRTLNPVERLIRIKDVVSDGQSALEFLEKNHSGYDVIIMDFQIAGGIMGEILIRKIKQINPVIQIIVITKMTINMLDFDFAKNLLEAGATWYCTKYPVDIEEFIYQPTDFILSIINAYEKKRLEMEQLKSAKKLNQNIEELLETKCIIGESEAIRHLHQQIEALAQSNFTVMIRGDSGTGKELVAANIHYLSPRRLEKFIAINCGSIPDTLIESELFGYAKGSFTGADTHKIGLFEAANHGTVFLDEVVELPLSSQVKLLRVIQEGEIDKIGRTDKIKLDVRVIAATNRNLEAELQRGNFREDLYYRLNVVSITVPLLNQRRDDIPLLVEHYFKKFCTEMNHKIPELSPSAMQVLKEYQWTGNVRELQNVIQRLLFMNSIRIDHQQVLEAIATPSGSRSLSSLCQPIFVEEDTILTLKEMEKNFRKKYFEYIREHSLSDAEASRKLGLAPPNFYRMCRELGLK